MGRVASTVFYANRKHRTRVVTAYNLGDSKPKGLKTNYQQQLRYIQDKDLDVDPETMFLLDLYALLKTWKDQGDRILLFIDANSHILKGRLARVLMGRPGLQEATHKAWPGGVEPNTYLWGKIPIDGVYHSTALE